MINIDFCTRDNFMYNRVLKVQWFIYIGYFTPGHWVNIYIMVKEFRDFSSDLETVYLRSGVRVLLGVGCGPVAGDS